MPQEAARIGKRLGQIVDEDQLRLADADDLAGDQGMVAADFAGADRRAVAAFQIAQRPFALRQKDLGVAAAAALVFDDDLVRRSAADGHRLTGNQTEHIGPFGSFADNQIR